METHNKIYECKKCDASFDTYNDLKLHNSSDHQNIKS